MLNHTSVSVSVGSLGPGAGYGRTVKDLKDTQACFKKTKLVLGELIYPYNRELRTAPQALRAANLMRRCCDATKGCLVYEHPTLDGRSFLAFSEVSMWAVAVCGGACARSPASPGEGVSDFTFTFHFHALEKEMATHSSVLARSEERRVGKECRSRWSPYH